MGTSIFGEITSARLSFVATLSLGLLLGVTIGITDTQSIPENHHPVWVSDLVHRATVVLTSDLGSCSGVAVSAQLVLTAAHCVDGVSLLFVELRDGTIFADVKVVAAGPDDIALLSVKDGFMVDYLRIARNPVREGEHVAMVGHPSTSRWKEMQGVVRLPWLVSRSGRVFETVGDPMGPGSSGCPVVNRYQEVVGIHVYGYTQIRAEGHVHLDAVRDILEGRLLQ